MSPLVISCPGRQRNFFRKSATGECCFSPIGFYLLSTCVGLLNLLLTVDQLVVIVVVNVDILASVIFVVNLLFLMTVLLFIVFVVSCCFCR